MRELTWDGCLNVRDLGGHPTEDGGETRYGAVVRADSVRQLTETGWDAVVEYGIRTVIDLRGSHERHDDPPIDLSLEIIHVPFMEADEQEWDELEAEVEEAHATPDVVLATRDVYLLFLEHFKQNVGAAVRAVAQTSGGVVVHCVGGKDRTGLLSALLLHLADVPVDDIATDYALSEERLRPRHEAWLASATTEAELERIRRITQTPAAAMRGVFAELARRYGSVEGFLRSAGVSDAELALARAKLRG